MKKFYLSVLFLAVTMLILHSCASSDEDYVNITDESNKASNQILGPVRFDFTQVPLPKLSDYHFFIGPLKNQNPGYKVIPYTPASTLFTDYALKKRFIWMPQGVQSIASLQPNHPY